MQQASYKCETPQLELNLKSLRSFLAIKRCEGTKIGKVFKLAQSSSIKVAHICANRGIPVKMDVDRCASRSGIPTRLDINREGKYPAAAEKR